MKIYQKIINSGQQKIKFLGFTFCFKKYDSLFIKTKFLKGLITIIQIRKHYYKEIQLFGIRLYSNPSNFNLKLCKKKIESIFFEKIIRKLGKQYRDVFIIYPCSGETYLFLMLFDSLYKEESKDVVFVATRKYHLNLFKMVCPHIASIYLPLHSTSMLLPDEELELSKLYKDICFYHIFRMNHFINLENKIQKNIDIHYFDAIKESLAIKEAQYSSYSICELSRKSALEKIEILGLNLDKFVFFAPESQSNMAIDIKFWEALAFKLKSLGYDVFHNTINNPEKYSMKSCFLTFEEASYIASLSKGMVGLRSGFVELLTVYNTIPFICFYTNFKERGMLGAMSAEKVISAYSLKKLPIANPQKIDEFVFQDSDKEKYFDFIIEKIEEKAGK